MNPTEQLLSGILTKITEMVEAQVSNYHKVISIDTTKDATYIIKDVFSTANQSSANSLYIANIGGGFDLYINDETPAIPAIAGLGVDNEQIATIRIVGKGAGTAVLRLGTYRR